MNEKDLASAIAHMRAIGSDTDEFEAKSCGRRLSKDVWESVSAFANTFGGTLLLGLSEENGFVPDPAFDAKRTLDQFVSGVGDGGKGAALLDNPPAYSSRILGFEGRSVLVIEIEENETSRKPCYIEARGIRSGSFKRVWDKDIHLSATELFELENALVRTGADREVVAVETELDPKLVDELLRRKEGSRALKGAQTREEKLQRLGVIAPEGGVTLAGLLVLGAYPQQRYPKLAIDVAVFPENEKGSAQGPRFIDRELCEGGVVEEINTAVEVVARNLRRVSVVSGTGRREELEIPREVLREAIANAVVHREYDARFLGQSVSVNVYPNRIEVRSPGGLWGTRTRENLAEGVSECRNDLLMSLVEGLPILDMDEKIAEGNGTGIPFMINEMKSRALGSPEFDIGLDHFVVRLGRFGTEILENRRWIESVTGQDLGRTDEAVLLLVRSRFEASVEDVHRELGLDSDEVRDVFKRLEARGLVLRLSEDGCIINDFPDDRGKRLQEVRPEVRKLYSLLSDTEPKDARELAEAMGKTTRTIQRYLRELMDLRLVEATTGRKNSGGRRYLRTR